MDEWAGLPWWQQDLYVDGLEWEFSPRRDTGDGPADDGYVVDEKGDVAQVVSLESMGVAWG